MLFRETEDSPKIWKVAQANLKKENGVKSYREYKHIQIYKKKNFYSNLRKRKIAQKQKNYAQHDNDFFFNHANRKDRGKQSTFFLDNNYG